MKIVLRDIYNSKADRLMCSEVSEEVGKRLVRLLNQDKTEANCYFQLVSDEYELKGDK